LQGHWAPADCPASALPALLALPAAYACVKACTRTSDARQ